MDPSEEYSGIATLLALIDLQPNEIHEPFIYEYPKIALQCLVFIYFPM